VAAVEAQEASNSARRVFSLAAQKGLHLALIELPVDLVQTYVPDLEANAETVTCLRSVLMKPEHKQWLDKIMTILDECAIER